MVVKVRETCLYGLQIVCLASLAWLVDERRCTNKLAQERRRHASQAGKKRCTLAWPSRTTDLRNIAPQAQRCTVSSSGVCRQLCQTCVCPLQRQTACQNFQFSPLALPLVGAESKHTAYSIHVHNSPSRHSARLQLSRSYKCIHSPSLQTLQLSVQACHALTIAHPWAECVRYSCCASLDWVQAVRGFCCVIIKGSRSCTGFLWQDL